MAERVTAQVEQSPPAAIINDYAASPSGNIIATSGALEVLSTTTFAASLKERPESLYPLDIPPRPTDQDVPATPQGIIMLASVGAWKSVLKVADKCISNMERPGLPHILLQLRQSKIVALIMIRSYKLANEELTALGNLDDPIYHFESYPSIYPDLKGSFVSFSLRLIQAELPSYLGNIGQTMDLLYHIQKRCRQEIRNEIKSTVNNNELNFENIDLDKLFGPAPPLPGSYLFNETIDPNAFWDPNPANFVRGVNDWRYRECWVTLIIATHLVKQKEYILALTIVEDISQRYPKDNILKSSVGRLYIQIGYLSRAREIFTEIEQSVGEKNSLVLMNRALLCVAEEKYEEAKECFCLLLLKDPNNCLAANNLAVCYLYTCHLIKAMHLLEDLIRKDPIKNLQESIVFNLCSLYDLYSDNNLEKKSQIMKLVSQYANDGFDYAMLKLPFPANTVSSP